MFHDSTNTNYAGCIQKKGSEPDQSDKPRTESLANAVFELRRLHSILFDFGRDLDGVDAIEAALARLRYMAMDDVAREAMLLTKTIECVATLMIDSQMFRKQVPDIQLQSLLFLRDMLRDNPGSSAYMIEAHCPLAALGAMKEPFVYDDYVCRLACGLVQALAAHDATLPHLLLYEAPRVVIEMMRTWRDDTAFQVLGKNTLHALYRGAKANPNKRDHS
jgi:hypothetical protein